MVQPETISFWLQTQAHITDFTLPGSAPLAAFTASSAHAGSLCLHLSNSCGDSQMLTWVLLMDIFWVNPKEVFSKLLLELLAGHRLLLQAGTASLVNNKGIGCCNVDQMLEDGGGPPPGFPVD